MKQFELESLGELSTRAEWRRALLALPKGEPTWLNGVPVTRLPCAGTWFLVGIHDQIADYFCQTLRLSDAVGRARAGNFVRLPKGPPLRLTCGDCQQAGDDRWAGAFWWCTPCALFICLDCQNDHQEQHEKAFEEVS